MRVGSLVYDCVMGLGVLAKSFYDAGIIDEVLIVNHRRPPHFQYPGAQRISGTNWPGERRTVLQFVERMDVVLGLETFFHWPLVDHCRKHGIKTALIPMVECLPPAGMLPYQPDLIISPSLLDLQHFPGSTHIPVPVDDGLPWERRDTCLSFVHNAGHGGLKGRNGTEELMEAWKLVKSPAKLTIRTQKQLVVGGRDSRISIVYDTIPHEDLYHGYDVFIFPERFNGLSLPLQEAHASGMVVMCGNRFPMNEWLPREPLIPVSGYRRNRVSPRCVEFDEAIISPVDIARTVDSWYGRSGDEVEALSARGLAYRVDNSWTALKHRYVEVLEKLVGGNGGGN